MRQRDELGEVLVQRACKPDSVPPRTEAATIYLDGASLRRSSSQPGSGNGPGALLPYLALLWVGFARPPCCQDAGALLPHHFTLTRVSTGGMFLLRFPSARAARALPGTLPGGVRTFLPFQGDRPARWTICSVTGSSHGCAPKRATGPGSLLGAAPGRLRGRRAGVYSGASQCGREPVFGTIATMHVKPGMEAPVLKALEEWGGGRGSRIDGPIRIYVARSQRDPNVLLNIVLFDSREHYEANANDPDQDRWYRTILPLLKSPPDWHDHEVLLAYEFLPPAS